MEKAEKIDDFYRRKLGWVPDTLHGDMGHFNVFKLDSFVGSNARPIPYKRRDYHKIMLVVGGSKVHYADKVVEVKKQALSFSNPLIPYSWEHTEAVRSGYFCIFNMQFFHQFGELSQYSVFQPEGEHIYELSDAQVETIGALFQRMLEEIASDYAHKYDLLRNLVSELLHFAMKMKPGAHYIRKEHNATQRITALFLELLERQFPIDEDHRCIQLRSASEFASQLNVHVNHLNRAVKETTQKTTSQIIRERILKESRMLLKQSSWDVSEIAYSLGFKEATHFSNYFKKHLQISPTKFRKA